MKFCLSLCFFFFLYACTDESDVLDLSGQTETEEYALNYTIEKLNSVVTSYSLASEEEEQINSLLYLFFDKEETCCGYTYYNNISIVGSGGVLPYKIPTGLKVENESYTIRVIVNLENYTDTNVETWAFVHVGMSWSSFSDMSSSLGDSKMYPIDGNAILYSGEFTLVNSVASIVKLKRRVCAVDVILEDTPIDISLDRVAFSSVPSNVTVFDDVVTNNTMVDGSNSSNEINKRKGIRLYVFPNLNKKDTIKLKLIGQRMALVDNGKKNAEHKMVVSNEKYEVIFPLSSCESTVLKANQVYRINVFQSKLRPDSLSYLVNDFPANNKDTRLFDLGGNSGILAVSETDVKLNFSSSYPMNDWKNSMLPDGSVSKEIFLSFSKNALPFELNVEKQEWCTVVLNHIHNSLIITARPNLSIANDGKIITVPRRMNVKLIFWDLNKTISFTVSQNQAPLEPVPVTLESGLTVYDKNVGSNTNSYCSATTSGRHVPGMEQQMVMGQNYYGDKAVKEQGHYYATGPFGSGQAFYLERIPADISKICPKGYGLPSVEDMCVGLYPHLRMMTQECVDMAGLNSSVLVFYATNGTNQIVVFPLIGQLGTLGYYWQNTLKLCGYENPENPTIESFKKTVAPYTFRSYVNCGIELAGIPLNNSLGMEGGSPLRCVKK